MSINAVRVTAARVRFWKNSKGPVWAARGELGRYVSGHDLEG
jgi:hypothetical protein